MGGCQCSVRRGPGPQCPEITPAASGSWHAERPARAHGPVARGAVSTGRASGGVVRAALGPRNRGPAMAPAAQQLHGGGGDHRRDWQLDTRERGGIVSVGAAGASVETLPAAAPSPAPFKIKMQPLPFAQTRRGGQVLSTTREIGSGQDIKRGGGGRGGQCRSPWVVLCMTRGCADGAGPWPTLEPWSRPAAIGVLFP
jgi:hypothetical protein